MVLTCVSRPSRKNRAAKADKWSSGIKSITKEQGMNIYVVEIPHQRKPSAWSALDQADFVKGVRSAHAASRSGDTLFEKVTARELAGQFGYEAEDVVRMREDDPFLLDLAEKHGWDRPLYRADYINGVAAAYQAEPISEYDACVAYIRQDLSSCLVYDTDEEALQAVQSGADWNRHGGVQAREALRAVLVRNSVLGIDQNVQIGDEHEEARGVGR
jgi:hypothetical protein